MDKLDLIRTIISVAGDCTHCKSTAEVCKTVAIHLVPDVIDFVDEKVSLARINRERQRLHDEAESKQMTVDRSNVAK